VDLSLGPVPPGWARLWLKSGGLLSGEVIAQYDQRAWWTAADRTTYGLFREVAFGPYPGDRSLSFVDSDLLAAIEWGPTATGRRFPGFLREKQFSIPSVPLLGPVHVILGHEGYHKQEDGYGDFAWDLVRTDATGVRTSAGGAVNADYLVWDNPVFLPRAGLVVEVVRDAPDNTPGSYPSKQAPNNLVGIAFDGHYYLYLLHFKQNTIPSRGDASCEPDVVGVTCIEVGAHLETGTYLGRVGNSGVSLEPHLHLTALYYDTARDPARSFSVPVEFQGIYLSNSPNQNAAFQSYAIPTTGSWISGSPF
jgi:hypothetical protein